MNPKNRLLIKDTIVFGLGSFGSKIILFLLVPLYTNYMSTEEYGVADLITVLSALAVSVFSADIHFALLRFSLSREEKRQNVARISMIICAVATILVFVFSPLTQLYKPMAPFQFYVLILCSIDIFRSCGLNYLKVVDKNRVLSLLGVMEAVILALVNIVLIRVFHMGIDGYLIANIVSYGVCTLVSLIVSDLLRDSFKGAFDKELMKRMLAFSFPLVFNSLIWWINTTSGKIIISGIAGVSALGIYTAATKVSSLLNLLISIFNQAWGLSSIREIEGEKDVSFFSNIFIWYSMAVTGAGIALISVVRPFVTLFMGEDFHEAWQYVPTLLAGTIFYAIGVYYESLYLALKKTVNSFLSSCLGAILNLVLAVILTFDMGIWGGVIGYCVGFFAIAVIRMHDVDRFMHLSFSKTRYYIGVADLLAVAMAVSFEFYEVIICIVAAGVYFLLYGKDWWVLIRKVIGKNT